MANLTKRVVDAAVPDARKHIFVWDGDPRGFGLLVLPSGTKSFIIQYRNAAGRSRRYTIGRFPTFTVDEARREAKDLLVAVAKGRDPVVERQAMRTAPDVATLLDRYLKEHVNRHNAATTRLEVGRLVERVLKPRIGHHQVNAVTTRDLARMHGELADTPRQANFCLAIASKAFSLAETWGLRPSHSNPTRGIRRFAEVERERFLRPKELARLGAALEEAEGPGLPWDIVKPESRHLAADRRTRPNPAALDAVLLLLFTGARLSEILSAEWSHVDLDAGTLALPDRKGQKRKPHPVSEAALEILRQLAQRKRGRWVLPGDAMGTRHVSKAVVENTWQKLRRRAEIEDVRLHDLRHTVGTLAGQLGANAFLIQHLLRHRNVAITGRYVNADADPIRSVSDAIGGKITESLARIGKRGVGAE